MALFYVQDIHGSNDKIRFRYVSFYNCDNRDTCSNEVVIDYPCFKEMKKVYQEINLKPCEFKKKNSYKKNILSLLG